MDRVYKFATHKINTQKSTIFIYTSCEQLKLKIKIPLAIVLNMKCLGINMTKM